jgi:hypothetical protein
MKFDVRNKFCLLYMYIYKMLFSQQSSHLTVLNSSIYFNICDSILYKVKHPAIILTWILEVIQAVLTSPSLLRSVSMWPNCSLSFMLLIRILLNIPLHFYMCSWQMAQTFLTASSETFLSWDLNTETLECCKARDGILYINPRAGSTCYT